MISYLRIRDLALVEDVVLEPGAGLTVLTGETGAGKSILLDGLALLAGMRASTEDIRAGADEAVVEGIFTHPAGGHEGDRSTTTDAPGEETLVRRAVTSTGSRAWLDDRLVTVGALRERGAELVEIAGQHESQSLLSPASHLELLDRFGDLVAERGAVGGLWDAALEIQRQLESLRSDERERTQRADYLRFQLAEIEAARLEPDEEVQLSSERQRLRNSEQLREAVEAALGVLYEGEDSAVALLDRAGRAISTIERFDPDSGLERGGLDEVRFTVDDVARTLQAYGEGLDADPARLQAVEDRLAVIDTLRRKYGDSVAEVLERAEASRAELDGLENRDDEIERLTAELRERVREFDRLASALGDARREAARRLEKQISRELGELGMEGARFAVRVGSGAGEGADGLPPGATRRGYETVEFELAANPGEPCRPLAKVASGGELSRVLLALKLAEVDGAAPRTLVFDEIDAGVGGGRVAERLARRLADLGDTHQVLVVTHLPQIAARAGSHFRVVKAESGGRTVVSVETLDDEARVDELARMLGGVDPTEDLRRHARSLLSADR